MNKKGPVYNYLTGLRGKWDGIARLDQLVSIGFGTGDDSSIGTYLMFNAASRFLTDRSYMAPAIILQAPQGAGKSRALRLLAGEFYSNTEPQPALYKRRNQLQWPDDCLIWEWSEPNNHTPGHVDRILLQRPWLADCPLVIITTLRPLPLPHAHRQISPLPMIKTNTLNPRWIDQNRDQLWAEIVAKIPANVHDIPTGGDHGPTSFIESGSQAAGRETVTPAPNPARSEGADQTESAAL